jgi:hypothetical protein
MKVRSVPLLLLMSALLLGVVWAQETVRPISPPKNPLPPEEMSAGVTRFSYFVYGDTRGRRDGVETQYEHSLIVDAMLARIKRAATTDYPVRFVLQTGDAVLDGGNVQQWTKSYIGLVERLTLEGGVSYFLAPGNHDVTSYQELDNAQRQRGLGNYLAAMSKLIPPDGSPRRLKGYPTYAFGYGNTFVVGLDADIAGDATQFDWVKTQLDGLDRRRYTNLVFFFHQSIFSSGPHGGAIVEAETAILRSKYMPLFRANHVNIVFSGHEHLFEHWVETYSDSSGRHRMDLIVTGGGGAPLYGYRGEPDLNEYLRSNAASRVQLEHLVKPGPDPGDNPYHFLIVRVDGTHTDVEIEGIDWGAGFRPYRSNQVELRDVTR